MTLCACSLRHCAALRALQRARSPSSAPESGAALALALALLRARCGGKAGRKGLVRPGRRHTHSDCGRFPQSLAMRCHEAIQRAAGHPLPT